MRIDQEASEFVVKCIKSRMGFFKRADRPTKALFIVVDNYLPSFANKNLGLFAKYMSSLGIPVRFISNATERNEGIDQVHDGVHLVRLPELEDRGGATLHAWPYYRYLLKHWREMGYVWLYRGRPYTVWTALLCKLLGAKVIVKLDSAGGTTWVSRLVWSSILGKKRLGVKHKTSTEEASGSSEAQAGSVKESPSENRSPRWKRLVSYWLRLVASVPQKLRSFVHQDMPLYLADVILCETPELVDELRSIGSGDQCVLWPNSLPTNFGRATLPHQIHHPVRKKQILSVGRIYSPKGFHLLIQAFAMVPPHEREGWQLKIVGPVEDEEYAKQLRTLVEKWSVAEDVDILPPIYGADLYRLYQESEVFAIAHLGWVGGQSGVIAEAMHFGCTVVSTDVGTIWYQLDRGACGVLVKPDAPHALSEALRKVIRDKDLRHRLASAGQERVVRHFSLERNMQPVLGRLGLNSLKPMHSTQRLESPRREAAP